MIRRTGVQHACGLYSTKLPATTWDTWWGYLHLFSVKKRRRNTHRIVFAAQFYLALACNPRQNSKLRLLIFNATGANVCWEFTTTPFKKSCYAPCSSHVAHALCVLVPEWGMTANEVIRDSTISYIYIYIHSKNMWFHLCMTHTSIVLDPFLGEICPKTFQAQASTGSTGLQLWL